MERTPSSIYDWVTDAFLCAYQAAGTDEIHVHLGEDAVTISRRSAEGLTAIATGPGYVRADVYNAIMSRVDHDAQPLSSTELPVVALRLSGHPQSARVTATIIETSGSGTFHIVVALPPCREHIRRPRVPLPAGLADLTGVVVCTSGQVDAVSGVLVQIAQEHIVGGAVVGVVTDRAEWWEQDGSGTVVLAGTIAEHASVMRSIRPSVVIVDHADTRLGWDDANVRGLLQSTPTVLLNVLLPSRAYLLELANGREIVDVQGSLDDVGEAFTMKRRRTDDPVPLFPRQTGHVAVS